MWPVWEYWSWATPNPACSPKNLITLDTPVYSVIYTAASSDESNAA